MERYVSRICLFLFLFSLLPLSVQGFGISQEYLEDKTIGIEQGRQDTIRIRVQNTEPIAAATTISVEGPYASFNGKPNISVVIPAGERNNYYFINISVPKNASIGSEHEHTWIVAPSFKREGQVGMTVKLREHFTVRVLKRTGFFDMLTGAVTDTADNIWGLRKSTPVTAGILIVAIIAFLLVMYRQSSILGNLFSRKKQPIDPFNTPYGTANTPEELALLLYEASPALEPPVKSQIATWVYGQTGSEDLANKIYNAPSSEEVVRLLLFQE